MRETVINDKCNKNNKLYSCRYPTKALIAIIKLYQCAISPYLPSRCRFFPSCSCYAIEAIETHGCFRGCYLALYRILRCQPFSKGGADPVPIKPRDHYGL